MVLFDKLNTWKRDWLATIYIEGYHIMINIDLVELRNNVATGLGILGSAERAYAVALNDTFLQAWYKCQDTDTDELAKAVKAEKTEFYKPLKAIGHKNPSTIMGRVRKYALEDAQQRGLFGEVVPSDAKGEGEGEGEGEGGGAGSTDRSPMLRNIEELTALYKFNRKQNGLSPELSKCQDLIVGALLALGVKVDMI